MRWQDIQDDREKYAAYLCSREWSVKKESVKKRSYGLCERCLCNRVDHVHHLTYARKYNEDLDDLQAVCKPCHDLVHGKSDDCFRSSGINVYFAGKVRRMSEDYRRHAMDWSRVGQVPPTGGSWPVIKDGIVTSMDATGVHVGFNYCGPYPYGVGGHGAGHGETTHGCGGYQYESEHAIPSIPRTEIVSECMRAIRSCHAMLVWIDDVDAYGTIAEIGFASALRKLIIIGVSPEMRGQDADMWFCRHMAEIYADDFDNSKEFVCYALSVCLRPWYRKERA